jgi:uncharacterized coiled-coil DUF342 family protein
MSLQEIVEEVHEKHDAECLRLTVANSQLTKERDEAQVDQRLIDELWERRTDMTEMKSQIELLRKERDEARREVCSLGWGFRHISDTDYAHHRGWDCFKEPKP